MNMESTLAAFERLDTIMNTLRKQCPWDSVQTMESLRHLTIEETYELSEAILSKEENDDLRKELGDLFMHLVFYCKIAEEENRFTLEDVLNGICDKLIDRHPFIYHPNEYHGESWEQLKMHEGRTSVLEGVPKSLPSLIKAIRMQEKAAGIGFPIAKDDRNLLPNDMTQEAFGDKLFALIHWANSHHINADDALCDANHRFQQAVEQYEHHRNDNESSNL